MTKLSTSPVLGTADRDPQEFLRRQYLFSARRRVCQRFGYEEYLTPLVEDKALYEAKSGEDVWGTELTRITNREGELTNLVIRPELTPSVTRLVAKTYRQRPKPIKRFAIPNFYRNEKPQKGRNREFWQLNIDIFGSTHSHADCELMQMAITIMRELNAQDHMWTLRINDRILLNALLLHYAPTINPSLIARTLDKRTKRSLTDNLSALRNCGCDETAITVLSQWMASTSLTDVLSLLPPSSHDRAHHILSLISTVQTITACQSVVFDPSIIRWFDYYDGIVFEMTDNHPSFGRSLLGWGRYNWLGGLFGIDDLPALGLGSGDEPMMIFLDNRWLLPKTPEKNIAYFPWLQDVSFQDYQFALHKARSHWYNCLGTFEQQKFPKIFSEWEKRWCRDVMILGPDDVTHRTIMIKNLSTGIQTSRSYA